MGARIGSLRTCVCPASQIDVIEYFGSDYKGQSVKRAIRQRPQPELPFLVAVTSRPRMGDAFPREVEWFLEFTKKATNLNALLQGLLGRGVRLRKAVHRHHVGGQCSARRRLQARARRIHL